MDEDKYVVRPTVANDTIFNTLLKIYQQNSLAIQNLAKYIDIIKRNTSKDDDINGNK